MREQIDEKLKIIEALRDLPIISGVCTKLHIPRSTVYRWINDDTDFAKRLKKALTSGNQVINDIAYGQLIKKIKEGSLPAITFHLTRRHPYYKEKKKDTEVKVKVIGPDGKPAKYQIPDEAFEAVRLSKLPKQWRKQILKKESTFQRILQNVFDEATKERGIKPHMIDFRSISWGKVLKMILEEES